MEEETKATEEIKEKQPQKINKAKYMFGLIILQILLICFIGKCILEALPVDIEDTKKIEIIVEDIEFENRSSSMLIVISDSEKYRLPSIDDSAASTMVPDLISIGDKITVTYYEPRYFWTDYNRVVAYEKADPDVSYSYDKYSDDCTMSLIVTPIIFLFFESGIVAGFIFLSLSDRKRKAMEDGLNAAVNRSLLQSELRKQKRREKRAQKKNKRNATIENQTDNLE